MHRPAAVRPLALALLLGLLAVAPAHAYLDPGSGSYFLQVIVASALGALYMLKSWFAGLLGGKARTDEDDEEEDEARGDEPAGEPGEDPEDAGAR